MYDVAPCTVPVEYVWLLLIHTDVDPVIDAGIPGVALTAKLRALPVPHPFTPATVTLPVVNDPLKLTVIAFVPAPLVIVAPAGTVHAYELAPDNGATENVAFDALHNPSIGPLITPGAVKLFNVTVRVRAELVPHWLLVVTDIVPPVKPAPY